MLWKNLLRTDVLIAAALAAISFGFVLYLVANPIGVPVFGVDPATLPTLLVLLIGLLSLVLAAQAAMKPASIRRTPTDKESDGWRGKIRLLALFALCIAFTASLPFLGYLISGAAFILGTALLFGNRRYFLVAIIVVLTPILISQFFEKLMVIYLPAGRLFG